MGKSKAEPATDSKPKVTGSRVAIADRGAPRKARTKKRRRKKAPDAPRRPATAFIRFSQANRARIIEQNPQASFSEIGRLLGQAWRDAPDEERMQYHEQEYQERAEHGRQPEPPDAGQRLRQDGVNDILLKRCAEAKLTKDARQQTLAESKPTFGRRSPPENPSSVLARASDSLATNREQQQPNIGAQDHNPPKPLGKAKMTTVCSDYIDLTDE